MKVKVESKKVGLKLNIQKMKIMASSPITSWEIDGETVETVSDFIFLESKKVKALSVSIVSPSICHEVMGPDAMIFVFGMLSFKPTFSLSTFTFIKRLF